LPTTAGIGALVGRAHDAQTFARDALHRLCELLVHAAHETHDHGSLRPSTSQARSTAEKKRHAPGIDRRRLAQVVERGRAQRATNRASVRGLEFAQQARALVEQGSSAVGWRS
jgi:hypothetical protein